MLYALGKNSEGWCFQVLHYKHFHWQSQGERRCFLWKGVGFCWSGDITEGKEVCDWIGIGSLVSKVTDLVEYVFVGTRTWRSSSEDEEFKEDYSRCWAAWECEPTVQRFWTAYLSGHVSFANVKSGSKKCQFQTQCLCIFLVCQFSLPTVEPCVKIKPENTQMKQLFLWFVS